MFMSINRVSIIHNQEHGHYDECSYSCLSIYGVFFLKKIRNQEHNTKAECFYDRRRLHEFCDAPKTIGNEIA
jgi:hypothetical protein